MKTFERSPWSVLLGALLGASCNVTYGKGGTDSAASSTNLLVNGSFEQPVLTAGYQIFPSIPGWTTASGPGIEIQRGSVGASRDGAQHVELDSTANSGMSQSVQTMSGQSLLVSFAYSPRPGQSASTNGVELRVDGNLLTTVAEDGTKLSNTSWSTRQFPLSARGERTTVEFRAVGTSDAFGGLIDDVRLTAQTRRQPQ